MIAPLVLALAISTAPDVYLLTGQSNMSGRGLLEELTPDERLADPAITLYGNEETIRPAAEPLDSPVGQIDAISTDVQAAVGPGLFFARALKSANGRPILLVPCAKGGSSIAQWAPGGGRDTLYGSCIARARALGGKVRGVLWYQGESDAGRADSAEAWREAFTALAARFRADLGSKRLPIVYVQLADPPSPEVSAPKTYPSWSAIQAVQSQPPPKCAAMVSAQGLPLKSDTLHLTTAGQRMLGGELAEAMDGLLKSGCR